MVQTMALAQLHRRIELRLKHPHNIHEVDDDDDDVQNNQPNLCKFAYNRECNQNGISSPRFEYCMMLRESSKRSVIVC